MAWYPRAKRMELQPESDNQAAIRPTQLLMHSIAAPWDENRIYAYWRDSTNLESHFGLDFDGSMGQFIGTETRADANYRANLRPDGTGAISIETASNLKHTDPWTPDQIEELTLLGVWAHRTHGIPLRICRSHDDPGFGYHAMYPEWSVSGTACPGAARIRQFREIVFPGIAARATGQTTNPPSEEDDMPAQLTESNPNDSGVKANSWTTVAMAEDSAVLQGPAAYNVKAYLTIGGKPGTRVKGRFFDLYLANGHKSIDLPLDGGVIGADGVLDASFSRPGGLAENVQLKLDVWASGDIIITHRVLRGHVWR